MIACFNVLDCCPGVRVCPIICTITYCINQDTYTHTLISGVYKDNLEDAMKAARHLVTTNLEQTILYSRVSLGLASYLWVERMKSLRSLLAAHHP